MRIRGRGIELEGLARIVNSSVPRRKRNPGTKPGEFAEAKARHQRRQAIQDAITKARTTPGFPVPLELFGASWEITGFTKTETLFYPAPMLVKISGKKLAIGWVCEKDGIWVDVPNGGRFHCEGRELAWVKPMDEAARKYLNWPEP